MNNYVKTAWVDNTIPALDAAHLNHIEDGIEAATQGVSSLEESKMNKLPSGSNGVFLEANNSEIRRTPYTATASAEQVTPSATNKLLTAAVANGLFAKQADLEELEAGLPDPNALEYTADKVDQIHSGYTTPIDLVKYPSVHAVKGYVDAEFRKLDAVAGSPNLFVLESQTLDGVTVTDNGDGTYTFNGENSTNTLFPSFTLPAGKYTAKMAVVSGSSTASGGGSVQAAIRYGSGDGTTWLNINNASAEITFNAATPVYFRLNHGSFSSWKLRISIEKENGLTAIDKTAREKAAELRTDVDSAAASINDISEARNLFKFDSQTLDGISVLNLGDGVFIINGTNSTTSLFPAFVLPAGTYNATLEKLSGTASNQYAVKYGDSGTTWVSTNKSASTVTFSKDEKVFFRLNFGTYTNLMLKIRIENVTAIDKFLRAKTDARRTALFPLPEPEGFTWKDSPLHGRILTDFRDVYEVDFDVAEYRNAIGTAVYVAPNGNDDNAGTIDAPLANMSTAYGTKNADTIYLLPGVYNRTQTLYNTPITRNINIIGLGSGAILSTKVINIINISEYSTGVWACSANATTYLTNVVDLVNKNSDGRYTKYTQLDSIPAVEASEGSWALISNVAYIHTIGGVKPVNGENLLLLHSTTPTSSNKYPLFKVTGGSVYFENLVCFGGSSALDVEAQSKNQIINVYGKNCKFFLSRRVSDSVERDVVMLLGTTLSIFQNCEASYGMKDGFNYHAKNYGTSQSPDYGVAPKAIEINCVGIGNGNVDDGNDQGSTIHDGGSIIRVKDLCAHNYGSNFADQGDGTESWNIACVGFESWCDYTRPTPSRSQNSNFYAYTGTKMFCDGCVGFGSLNDVSGAGDIYIKNSRFAGYLPSGYSKEEVYSKTEVYTKAEVEALIQEALGQS